MPRRVAVALGGNAILDADDDSFADQRETVRETVRGIRPLHEAGADLLVTHGNGPQVGNRLLEDETTPETPSLPLDVHVAETQASVGALLQRTLDAALGTTFLTVVTQAVVDPDAPAFDDPTKPVGPRYTAEEADGTDFETRRVEEGDRPYRRVVASPPPEEIIEAEAIAGMLDGGRGVVAGGGGGVPVARAGAGFEGVPAVVDKDATTALLADHVGADVLLFVTDVPCAYRDYPEDPERIASLSAEEARDLLDAGTFGEGSMRPKVEACVRYVEATGNRAVVTDPSNVGAALDGAAGTTVRP